MLWLFEWLQSGQCLLFLKKKTTMILFRYLSISSSGRSGSSVQFSHSVISDSLPPHESQHTRPPCPSPTPGVHWDSRPLSQWCHPSRLILCHPLLLLPPIPPSIRVFSMSQLFAWGGQCTGVSASASFPPKKSQGWSPLQWTGWIKV